MAETPAGIEVLLQEIRAGVEDLRQRRDELESSSKLEVGMEGIRADLARLESKFDQRERLNIERDNKLLKLDQKVEQLARTVASQGSRLTYVERSVAQELDNYRSEKTKIYGKVIPDE